uniref:Candidate secreted effector n=1 Tax=Meloidogyne incognita TaxID=6306 RepID=A0A914KIL0_MELIC
MNNPPQKFFSLKFPIILIIFLYFNNLIKAHLTDNEQIYRREEIKEEKWSEVDELRSENEKSINDNDLFKSGKNGEEDKEEVFEKKESLFSFVKAKEEINNEEEEENNGEEDWVINKRFGRREEEEGERKEIREDESQSNFLNNFYKNNKWNNNDDNDGQFKFWQWTENYMPKMGGVRRWEMWGREENNEEESNDNWNELMENKWKIDNDRWKDENYVNKEYNNNNGLIHINGLLPRINGQYWKGFNEIEDKNEIEKISKEKTIEVEKEEEEKKVEEEKEVEEEGNKKEENNNGRFSWGGIFNKNENNGERNGNCWWKKILNGIGNVAKMFVKGDSNEKSENLDNLDKFGKIN